MIDIDISPVFVTGLSSASINKIIMVAKQKGELSSRIVSPQQLGVRANGVPIRRLQFCKVYIRDDSPARIVVFSYLLEASTRYGYVAFMDTAGAGQWSDPGFGLEVKLGGSGSMTVQALADGEILMKVIAPQGWHSLQPLPAPEGEEQA